MQPNPIVPPRTVARRALLALVAIMSFLACLSVAAVSIVSERAYDWRNQIAEEVTIQVKPASDGDTDALVARAVDVALQVPGIRSAVPISEADAAKLLEPWLGRDFDRSELPVPRLIAVRIAPGADIAALSRRLHEEVPNASLDDHSLWMKRLSSMANVMMMLGLAILLLVMVATALCVVFATRGAMAGSRDVIEVLHFIGAEDSYVAREYQRHFLVLGLKGAGIGGALAAGSFLATGLVARFQGSTPEEAQLRTLFGSLIVGPPGYLGALATVLVTAGIIAVTARWTVTRTLKELEHSSG
ncbi:cell division protein FtsX [Propylenella binzhouense]|uniref:ABC transporter permease n=1 Tax=Propylenella binzhouense TaxID=2555902 RepID=A0A964T769_9HYPH|nr:ABC transporter permease [Propylenella binzhouense]MYZ49172.1 ABC transporter permease [Propylenella binzhouense]